MVPVSSLSKMLNDVEFLQTVSQYTNEEIIDALNFISRGDLNRIKIDKKGKFTIGPSLSYAIVPVPDISVMEQVARLQEVLKDELRYRIKYGKCSSSDIDYNLL